MAQEKLEIIISAETQAATKQIADFGKTLKGLDTQANAASAGVSKFNKSVANANPTLVNFGRVIQDAPFGIIGIANNIDPLLSSFQSLQKQTGSAGSAFKALGASLLGPAGIAVGVSAATSALIAFGPQIGRAISGVNRFEQAQIDAAGKSGEAFIQAQNKFNDYLKVVNDGTVSIGRQNAALEGANRLLSDYGLKITDVATLQKQGAQIGSVFAQIKQEEAKAQFLAAKAAEEYSKGLVLQAKIQQGDVLGTLGELSFGDILKTVFGGGIAGGGGSATAAAEGVANAFQQINKNQKVFQDAADQSKNKVDELIKGLKGLDGITENYNKTKTESNKTSIQEIDVLQKKQQTIIGVISANQKLLDLARLADAEAEKKKKQDTATQLKNIQSAAGLANINTRGIGPSQSILNAFVPSDKQLAQLSAFDQAIAALKANSEQLVATGVDAVIGSVFDSLANGGNVFESLGQAVKGFVLQLIRAVAQAVILNAIMKALNIGTGGTGGGVFNILSGILGRGAGGNRAGGGAVLAGQSYTVGEFGAERFVPAVNGSIVPSMGMSGGTLTATVSGNDLLFILDQAGRNRQTNFG